MCIRDRTPGARPAEVAPGMVKNKSPKLCAWVAWIWLVVIVLSDGVAWTDDAGAAVGWAVVVGAVGVVAGGVARGADGVVDLTGAAGAACRAGLRRGASTVTCGSGLLPGVAVGGAGVVCGAGVSDAGVVVCGASAGVDGVCDQATPVKQSANSAELLTSSERLLRIDMTIPSNPSRETPVGPDDRCVAAKRRRMGIGSALAHARRGRYRQVDVRRGEARARRAARNSAVWSDQIRPRLRMKLG